MIDERTDMLAAAGDDGRSVLEPAAGAKRGRQFRVLRGSRAHRLLQIGQFIVLMFALLWLIVRGSDQMGYNWQWYRVPGYLIQWQDGQIVWGTLAGGLLLTIEISAYALVLATLIGLCIALLRLSDSTLGVWFARGFLELVRNTPLLVQIYLFYFVVAPVYGIDRFWAGVLCLALFEGVYASEIFRSGILAIEHGQWDASYSLGMPKYYAYRLVILPQAIRVMLPPLAGIAISLVKDSSILSVIAVAELTSAARDAVSDSFMSFEIWFTAAALYLVLTVSLSAFASYLERRMKFSQ
jgi:polar amino acid transport system permease protein